MRIPRRAGAKGRAVFLILLLSLGLRAFSQDYALGAVLDSELYDSLPQKAALVTRAYTALPESVSLKQYAPIPGDQNPYGTCVAWASAYAARTISESVITRRRDQSLITGNVYSPVYVYKSITDDPECQAGAAISWALDLMKAKGAAKMLDIERSMDFGKVSLSSFNGSRKYPIADYVTLYHNRERRAGPSHTDMVKKSLAEGKPVIIGMNCPESFLSAKEVWNPRENPGRYYGGHAMCVVGYDDAKYGGAFEIQNSWGRKWGNGGYIWIPYEVFGRWVLESYEIIENLAAFNEVNQYSGSVQIELYRGGQNRETAMPVEFTAEGYYRTTRPYPSGTEFRFLLGNDDPAYVYAFAADSSSAGAVRIFPAPDSAVSPILDYSANTVVWPGDTQWIKLDERPGTDYLVVLFSKEALPIDAVMKRFEQAQGAFPQRAAQAVGSGLIPYTDGVYEKTEIRFTARSADSKAVFALLLAIEHE
jgi:hypothetical protein